MPRLITRPLTVLAGLLLLAGFTTLAVSYTLAPEASTMRVEGTSTLHDWSCPVEGMEGAFTATPTEEGDVALTAIPRVEVKVPVNGIACDKDKMNNKLREALKANAYPQILFFLKEANLAALPDSSDGWFQVDAQGEMIIAGTRQPVEMDVKGQRLDDGRLRFVGSTPIQMSTFEVERPSFMLGAVTVGDEVTVHFDVTAKPAS